MSTVLLFSSPIGPLTVVERGGTLSHLLFSGEMSPDGIQAETPLLLEAAAQLQAYFTGELRQFDLPLSPSGTLFQQKVWTALRSIPYGETKSYGEIAAAVGSPKACRAVGMANHHNPLPIFIPCHRVIGTGGKLTGYAGGLDRKRFLLELEQNA
jgi:methylated-DNA-[protein]-cysteine S-methyltransferase